MARPVTHSRLNRAVISGLGERVEIDPRRVRLREEVAQLEGCHLCYLLSKTTVGGTPARHWWSEGLEGSTANLSGDTTSHPGENGTGE